MKLIDLFESKQDWELLKKHLLNSPSKPSSDLVNKTIDDFKNLLNNQAVKGKEKDIHGFWRKLPIEKAWNTFYGFINKKDTGNIIKIQDDSNWLILIPLDKAASCKYGTTNWCISRTKQDHFDTYFFDEGVSFMFFINKKTNQKWCLTTDFSVFDPYDSEITDLEFFNSTKLKIRDYYKYFQKYKKELKYFQNITKNELINSIKTKTRNIDLEQRIYKLNSPNFDNIENIFTIELILKYMVAVNERIPLFEKIILPRTILSEISDDNKYSNLLLLYIKNVIKGRWEELEQVFLKYTYSFQYLFYNYVLKIVKTRWPAAEHKIREFDYLGFDLMSKYIKNNCKGKIPNVFKAKDVFPSEY